MSESSSVVYTSAYTSSGSRCSDEDSLDAYDIALIYNTDSNLQQPVSKAKIILQERKYDVRDSNEHGHDAGISRAELQIVGTKRAKYRIVIFNLAYKKHDLQHHAPMLYNRDLTTKKNTLVVLRKKHMKKLPEELRDLPRREVENVSGEQLAEVITDFILAAGETSAPSDVRYEKQYENFRTITESFTEKRSFLLIVNVASPVPSCVKYLARVPWIKVFDFDKESEEKGILGTIKPHLTEGKFEVSASDESPQSPSDAVTDWTRLITTERETNAENSLDAHVKSIAQYCSGQKVATLVILWYPDNQSRDFDLLLLVHNIEIAFQSNRGINCVLFTPRMPDSYSALSKVTPPSNRDSYRFVLPLTVFCEWVRKESVPKSTAECRLLPCNKLDAEHNSTVKLSERNYNWLSVDMDVLTLSTSVEPRHPDIVGGVDFLRGGTISWKSIEEGIFDARRGLLMDVMNYLHDEFISRAISGAVYIHHHPGSGGTTFGRRVLWEMRKVVPCMAVHPPFGDTEDFREKIKFVRSQTYQHTVLLLMDGNVEVEKTLTALSYERVIILAVVRYHGPMENKRNSSGHFYLKDEIIKQESVDVLPIYSKYGDHSCESLRQRPSSRKTYMYEYGLTAFTENFYGVRRYVKGHLKLDDERKPWHLVIGYLAMAWHYGQQTLPCEMFSHLLKTMTNSTVKKDDIPFHGRQLLKEEGAKWSITYSEVAREILKQLLSKDDEYSPTHTFTLDLKGTACDELKELAIGFLTEMQRSLASCDAVPKHKLLIIREVFILRKELYDEVNRKKPKYSMLLRDVEKDEHRGAILRKLVECFPKHADFHAHLGRYYGKLGLDEEAELSFSKAIDVRMEELTLHHGSQESDEVLQRIHHMLGNFYFSRIPKFTDRNHSVEAATINKILSDGEKAIKQFELARKYFVLGTNPTYAFLGEVKVYLKISNIAKDLNLLTMDEKLLSGHLLKLKEFYLQSFGMCDHLLAQCLEQATESQLRYEFRDCVDQMLEIFQASLRFLEERTKRFSTLPSRLCQIAILKNRLGQGHRFSVFAAKGEIHLKRLQDLYESVIRSTIDNRKRISCEMIDWLKIIRRTKTNYSLENVLECVNIWDKRNEKDSLSTYYLYVINFVFAITFLGENMSREYRKKVKVLRGKLESSERTLLRQSLFRSHEWLGTATEPTIHALVHRDVLGPEHTLRHTTLLRRCTGKIVTVKGWYGFIHLDGFSDPVIQIFFAPQKYKLTSQHAKEKLRAEFYLGFNAKNGAEAFELTVFESKACPCGNITEVKSDGSDLSAIRCRVCNQPLIM